jgi:hypothetical protein
MSKSMGYPFLGAFAKLRKATVRFVMSVCHFAWNNSTPNGQILIKFYIQAFFRKSVERIEVSLKCDKNNEYLT